MKRLICFVTRRHQSLCENIIVLDAYVGGEILHQHTCLRCGNFTELPSEPLPDGMELMIRSQFLQQNVDVRIDTDPPSYVH